MSRKGRWSWSEWSIRRSRGCLRAISEMARSTEGENSLTGKDWSSMVTGCRERRTAKDQCLTPMDDYVLRGPTRTTCSMARHRSLTMTVLPLEDSLTIGTSPVYLRITYGDSTGVVSERTGLTGRARSFSLTARHFQVTG